MSTRRVKYFVIQGKMYSAEVIAELDFDFKLEEESDNVVYDNKRYLKRMFHIPDGSAGNDIYQDGVLEFVTRPGKWYFMTGYVTIHADDTFDTREEAAKNQYNLLMGGGNDE